MKNINNDNMDFDDLLEITDQFKPAEAKKSKEQVWAELELMIEKPIKKEAIVRSFQLRHWRVAASIALLISFSTLVVFRFYTKNVVCLAGNQTTAYLPDGSVVQLNASNESAEVGSNLLFDIGILSMISVEFLLIVNIAGGAISNSV
jgi:hypothetical protein